MHIFLLFSALASQPTTTVDCAVYKRVPLVERLHFVEGFFAGVVAGAVGFGGEPAARAAVNAVFGNKTSPVEIDAEIMTHCKDDRTIFGALGAARKPKA